MPDSRRIGVVAMLLASLGGGWYLRDREPGSSGPIRDVAAPDPLASSDDVRQAFESHARGRIIAAKGVVERILADDRDGSPHQRFIIRTNDGVSLMIAHNLDLAPRLEALSPGDAVEVLGEYEWNEKGGVMHWTHDDPLGQHRAGYIEWRGRRYQ